MFAPGRLLFGLWVFVESRRWLVAALLFTAVLLALLLLEKPQAHDATVSSDDLDVAFDDVKTFPMGSKSTGSRPHAQQNRPAEIGDDVVALEPMALGRRLHAVRMREARGAWLTGTIETVVAATASNQPSPGTERTASRPETPIRAAFDPIPGTTTQ
jgi:hypothetical protein